MKLFISTIIAALVACLLLVATQIFAADSITAQRGDTTITLTAVDCQKDGLVAQLIGPADIDSFRDAIVLFRGKTIRACWKILDAESILLVDEEGDAGKLPQKMFGEPNTSTSKDI